MQKVSHWSDLQLLIVNGPRGIPGVPAVRSVEKVLKPEAEQNVLKLRTVEENVQIPPMTANHAKWKPAVWLNVLNCPFTRVPTVEDTNFM